MDLEKEARKVTGTNENVDDVGEEHAFDFSFTDGRGKTYSGRFVNRVLTNNMRAEMHILAARARGGLPPSAFDPKFNFWVQAMSHISVSLHEDRPDWAQDFGALKCDDVIVALWEEAARHEAMFWRREKGEKKGPRDGNREVNGAGKRPESVGSQDKKDQDPDMG